jgi:hypothetical protein
MIPHGPCMGHANNVDWAYMQKVWYKELEMDCLEFQSTWENIYKVKIKQMSIMKLAEFNYKILSGTIPCGMALCKWKTNISPICNVCNTNENIKHMLYSCCKATDIWDIIAKVVKVDIKWKHIVVGYFFEQNVTTVMLNWIISLSAYSIFKTNNQSKR